MVTLAYWYAHPLAVSDPAPPDWGEPIAAIYQDWESGRPALAQLLETCQHHPPSAVLLRDWADLGDTLPAIFGVVQQLGQMGIAVQIAGADPAGRPWDAPTAQALARQLRSRQIRRGHAQQRVQHHPPPGPAPYGYQRQGNQYQIDPVAGPILRAFFEHFLLYGSLRGAVRHLAEGYGKTVAVTTGRRWLTHPVYRGDLAHRGQVVRHTHPALLDREEAAQIDRLLRRNRTLPPKTASAPRSLAGLVYCGACQQRLQVTSASPRQSPARYTYLVAKGCPLQPRCRALAYDHVLHTLIHQVCESLPQAAAQVNATALASRQQDLAAALQAQASAQSQITTLVKAGILDADIGRWQCYQWQTRTSALQAQQAQLPPVNLQELAQAVAIPQFWLDLSEPERRFFFREFMRRVWLHRQGDTWTLELDLVWTGGVPPARP